MAALIAIETVVLALLTVLVAGLLRSHAAILQQLHELGADLDPNADPNGAPVRLTTPRRALTPDNESHRVAADLVGTGVYDDVVSLRVADVEHRTLLAFLSSGCLTCREFWDAFRHEPLGLPDDVRLVVVTKDAAEESLSVLDELAPAHLPVIMSSDAWRDYAVPGSPYFVLADGPTARVIGEGTGASWPQVLGLLTQATGDDLAGTRRRATSSAVDLTAIDRDNEARIDRELLAAGITPGHPSLQGTNDGAPDAPGDAR
jgi:hypothetical protein